MKYRIVITALEPNPNYKEQLAEYERTSRFAGAPPYAMIEIEVKKLETVVTEAEFVAIRNAALGVMAAGE